jgi:hypothetical protein
MEFHGAMRCKHKLSNVWLPLYLTLLVFGYGHLTARPQTGGSATINNPDPGKHKRITPPRTQLRLSAISGPQSGGNRVTITGSGFNDQTKVIFGSLPAEIIKPVQTGTITVVVPGQDKVGSVPVVISTPGRKGSLRARYQYKVTITAPVESALGIIRIEPGTALPNKDNTLTIYGRNFTPRTEVQIEGRSFAPEFRDPGVINVFIPSGSYGSGAKDVVVKNRDGRDMFTMVDGFIFIGPKIFWIEPSRGGAKGGEHVRIYGRYLRFKNLADVLFGDIAIREGKSADDDEHTLYVDTPPHEPGWVDVVVYNAYGQRTILPKGYYYEAPKDPAKGPEKYSKLRLSLFRISVEEDGNSGKGNSWSFDIRVNSIRLCDLESRIYSSGPSDIARNSGEEHCRQEIRIEENEVRVRVIGTRGDAWVEGETTVPLTEIIAPAGIFARNPIEIHVRANNEKKGHFVFRLMADTDRMN